MRDLAAYQDSYQALPFEDVQARFRKRKICEFLAKHRARRILEVGCGLDPLFNHYLTFDRCTVIEPAERFFENARAQAQGRTDVQVIRGTLEEKLPELAEGEYDFIVLSSLLHEIADPVPLLDAAATLCSPPTIVHVNVPNAYSVHRLLAVAMGVIGDVHARSSVQVQMQQSHTFDVAELRTLVQSRGFRVVEEGTFFIKPFTHAQMASLQRSGFLTESMLEGFYRLSPQFPDQGSEICMNMVLDGAR